MTPTEIVAGNIKRIREETGLSRRAFADKIGWSEHRLLDLEHGRERRPAASPDELFALCAHLPVTVFDLLLPPPGIEEVDLPTDVMAPSHLTDVVVPTWGRRAYGQQLFGISARYLEPKGRPRFAEKLAVDSVREAILSQHQSVVDALALLRQKRQEVLRDLTAALIAEGVVSLENEDGDLVVVDPALVTMSVEEARAESAKASQLVADALDLEIGRIERRIKRGDLPEPPSADYPQQVWGAYARGDTQALDQLAAKWLAEIEKEDG